MQTLVLGAYVVGFLFLTLNHALKSLAVALVGGLHYFL